MKVLVFGQSGQVARELARRLPPDATATFLSRTDADLTQPATCAAAIATRDQRNTADQIKHLAHALALSIISTKR